MSSTMRLDDKPQLTRANIPAWKLNQPTRPSKLRSADTQSLTRSSRVASLVDLLPPGEDEKEGGGECVDDPVLQDNMISGTRNGDTNQPDANSDPRRSTSGLGISLNMNQRLEKVDEWLGKEHEEMASPSSSIRGRVSKANGPRKPRRRHASSSKHRDPLDPELLPSPLVKGKGNIQPTTPGGGARAFNTPEPKPEDVGKSADQLIDELMDGLYRDQARSLTKDDGDGDFVPNDESSLFNTKNGGYDVESTVQTTPTRNSILLLAKGRATLPAAAAVPSDFTPTRRVSSRHHHNQQLQLYNNNNSHSISLSTSQQSFSSGFAPSPSRTTINTDPFHPSPLRISRKPVQSPPRIVLPDPGRFEPTNYKSFPILPVKSVLKAGPAPEDPPPVAYGHRIYSKPETVNSRVVRVQHQRGNNIRRPILYFFDDERESIAQSVFAKEIVCKIHKDCYHCLEREFAYFEIKAMPTTVPPEERAKILAGNRSLRTIKTELENLLENGLISDDAYNNITELLPSEGTFNAGRSPAPTAAPTAAFQAMTVSDAPPAYHTPNPPSLPTRQSNGPPARPEISRAVALYPYSEPEDCTFVVGDEIAVYEHMNKDWWMGRNIRTGKEGVFPVNYVTPKAGGAAPSPSPYGNEKQQSYNGYPAQQQQQQYNNQGPPPPGPSNPYNSDIPPSAVANQPSKGGEMGKKFGKKLGNAAIFGAGASIGGKIVNGIF